MFDLYLEVDIKSRLKTLKKKQLLLTKNKSKAKKKTKIRLNALTDE